MAPAESYFGLVPGYLASSGFMEVIGDKREVKGGPAAIGARVFYTQGTQGRSEFFRAFAGHSVL